MDYNTEMENLNKKLSDLKQLFKVGEKVIPGIQKLIEFMAEILPLLNNINFSIEESTKKIPKASVQLNDVSHATEIATTEILDKVDMINSEIMNWEDFVLKFNSKVRKRKEVFEKLCGVLADSPQALELLNEYENLFPLDDSQKQIKESISRVREGLETITITLQVQDITAQQLSAVNHLIVSVQKKLSGLIVDLSGEEIKVHVPEIVELPNDVNFDPDASFTRKDNRQGLADEIINHTNIFSSQDEIDKLFNNNGK
jgi:chemotaxis regulatin CheY-phosphate phosphatase CheZ